MDSLKKIFGYAAMGVGLIAGWQFLASSALMTQSQFITSAAIAVGLTIGGGWLAGSGASPPSPAPA